MDSGLLKKKAGAHFARKLLLFLIGGFLFLGFASRVFAAGIQLPQTGQTQCYDGVGIEIPCAGTGQDGEIQAGLIWPNPRFTDNGDGTVTDKLTGLVWTKDAGTPTFTLCAGGSKSWQQALDYVNCLNNHNCLNHHDWRLPNINELESLVNSGEPDIASWLNSKGFVGVQSDNYWSSSTALSYSSGNACVVHLGGGYIGGDSKSSPHYVWPLRAVTTSSRLPQTRQTQCYDGVGIEIPCAGTGQDGEIQAGLVWPNPRFTDNGGTVTDELSGLVWLKDANCAKTIGYDPNGAGNGYMEWDAALNFIKAINSQSYPNCSAGYEDWRLPNREELRSLTDYSFSTYNILPADNHFTEVDQRYWTSTTASETGRTANSWFIDMYISRMVLSWKGGLNQVWPVRSGQIGPLGNFRGFPRTGFTPLLVNFTDMSQNATSWLWDFGDGDTSAEQNPVHLYKQANLYTVKLTASNGNGPATVTKTGYITVQSCISEPVIFEGTTYHTTSLQTAYNDWGGLYVIEAQALDFTGGLTCDEDKVITLKGGYNCDFSSPVGHTVVSWPLTISKGTVTIENFVIK